MIPRTGPPAPPYVGNHGEDRTLGPLVWESGLGRDGLNRSPAHGPDRYLRSHQTSLNSQSADNLSGPVPSSVPRSDLELGSA